MLVGAVGAALVLSGGWRIGVALESGSAATSAGPLAPGASSTPAVISGARAKVSGTFDGSSVSTRYGSVQVRIVVIKGRITDVAALHLTDAGGRSVQISNAAAPILRSEVLAAQSARVAAVSGATYTTDGYLTSLQAALDRAKI